VVSGVFTMIELGVAIIAACLPTLVPVFRIVQNHSGFGTNTASSQPKRNSPRTWKSIVTFGQVSPHEGRQNAPKYMDLIGEGPLDYLENTHTVSTDTTTTTTRHKGDALELQDSTHITTRTVQTVTTQEVMTHR
jgi:hypothetical protein